ncbi:MAG: protein translocase subunit SecD [Chloroflexi bacterium]|nr:protein translocase subunit SecD [Chloroflexota bacterium]
MLRRNTVVLLLIAAIFAFSASAVFLPMFGRENLTLGLDLKGGIHLVYKADLSAIVPGAQAQAMDSAIAVIEKRVNALGVTEPAIQKQGQDRILVDLPGISEVEKAKNLIGQTALLEFGEQVTSDTEQAKWTDELGKWKSATGTVNGQAKELTSSYFRENTYVSTGDLRGVLLNFEWNDEGSKLSEQITGRLKDKPLGIFLGDQPLRGDDGRPIAPIVRDTITTRGVIEGLSLAEAETLSKLLNAGRLPVPLTTISEESVSPILGSDFVDRSIKAGIIGIIMVMVFMVIYYRLPGFLASLSLVFYGALVLALFKLIPVTLTLAGIGGFVLSVGMAVDANVLIFERMKEEFLTGRTLGAAIEAGFNRAWTAIRDSNITTFIVCFILYWLGSATTNAPVQGFAVTLFVGVAVSMFTALVVTKGLLRLFVGTSIGAKVSLFSIHPIRSGKSNV